MNGTVELASGASPFINTLFGELVGLGTEPEFLLVSRIGGVSRVESSTL